MKAVIFALTALLLVGCEERYRYPCQDPENKDNPECNRPACEADGFCYDDLNGIKQEMVVEETPCNSETEIVSETTGE
jgi:hypothetical protein